jgi:hypothetical protein
LEIPSRQSARRCRKRFQTGNGADLQDVNPMMLRQLSQNPEAKKELAENVAELFAVAGQAEKEGLAADIDVRRELENFETEILATNYDKAINKDKGPMPPFGFISEERMNQFWDGSDSQPGFLDRIGFGSNTPESREQAFEKFLESKLKILKEGNPQMKDREITEEERKQARNFLPKREFTPPKQRLKKALPITVCRRIFSRKSLCRPNCRERSF